MSLLGKSHRSTTPGRFQVLKGLHKGHTGIVKLKNRRCSFYPMVSLHNQSTTGLSPAEPLFNRKLKTKLNLIHPEKIRMNVQKQ